MATQAILVKMGSAVVFTESGGNVTFTLNDGVAAGDGQVSNQWDRGPGALPTMYLMDAKMKWVATPAIGDTVRIYICASQETDMDLIADGPVTPESKFSNFRYVGNVICSVAADKAFRNPSVIEIVGRYVNIGVWNASATKALNATANACSITLTPCYPEVQAAA